MLTRTNFDRLASERNQNNEISCATATTFLYKPWEKSCTIDAIVAMHHYNLATDEYAAKRPGTISTLGMLSQFIDTSLKIFAVISVGEFLRRIYLIVRELTWYKIHYEVEGRFWTITRRSFCLNKGAIILLLAFGAVVFVRFAMTKEIVLPPIHWYPFIILYWLFTGFNLSSSGLSNAEWIRQSYGIDYATGMASNYFHGYLKLTLPSHTGHLGIKQRIELYEAQQHVEFAVKRLVILIPNTMYVNGKIESKILTKQGVAPLEVIYKNRAGVSRPFKNDIYKFTIPINGTFYYVAMEGATPMLSFFESMHFQPSTTWEIKETKREILIKFYKHLKKLLKEWPETQDEAELILYNAYKSDGSPQDVGEILLSHITNMWNEGRV